jgi:DNA polymerase-3 subunit beta
MTLKLTKEDSMKVVCDRNTLAEAIDLVSNIALTRAPNPMLTCVHITACDGQLVLAATDGEAWLSVMLSNVAVERHGVLAIPAANLRNVVAGEKEDPTLTLSGEGGDLLVSGFDARFRVCGYSANDYPALPEFPASQVQMKQPAASLAKLLANTMFATGKENSRYSINGVFIAQKGKRLEVVGTDGRRLAISNADASGKDVSFILPNKAATLVRKIVAKHTEDVEVATTDNMLFFRMGTPDRPGCIILAANKAEGTFPPYGDLVKTGTDKRVTVDRQKFISAMRRAAILTNEESRGVRMQFAKGKPATFTGRAPEVGEGVVQLEIQSYDGEPIEIGFNPSLIWEGLGAVADEVVSFEMNAPSKPGVMRADRFLYLVMPITLT